MVGRAVDGLAEGHDGVGDANLRAAHEVLLQILEANLEVQLAGAGDDVLARLLDLAQHHGVRLGEALEALHQLGQVLRVLALHRDAHDGGDGELHRLERVRLQLRLARERGVLGDELVEANHGDGVARGDILDGVLAAAHANHGALDGLDVQILLLARDVVGAEDAHLHARLHRAGEDAAEGEEAALVRGGDHLRDVQHQGAVRVAVANGLGVLVVQGALVQGVRAVLLRRRGRGQVVDDHLQQRDVGGEPRLHDALHQGLAEQIQVRGLELVLHLELLQHGPELVLVVVHGGVDDAADGLVAELHKGAHARLLAGVLLGPLLRLGVEEVVAPQLLHHLVELDAELSGVHFREDGERERPVVKPGGEAHGALLGEHLAVAERLVGVRRHEDVRVLDDAAEVLVRLLAVQHQLQEAAVQLVHRHHRADALAERLAQHRLRLHADALHAIHHDERAVRDAQRGGHLGGEVDVAGGVDQVDQVVLAVAGHLLGEARERLVVHLVKERDAGGLDGDAAILLILTSVRQARVARVLLRDDTRGGDEGVREGGLAL